MGPRCKKSNSGGKIKSGFDQTIVNKTKGSKIKNQELGDQKKNKCGVRVTSVKVTSVIIALGSLGKVGVRN